jgi:hypothetical protein
MGHPPVVEMEVTWQYMLLKTHETSKLVKLHEKR